MLKKMIIFSLVTLGGMCIREQYSYAMNPIIPSTKTNSVRIDTLPIEQDIYQKGIIPEEVNTRHPESSCTFGGWCDSR